MKRGKYTFKKAISENVYTKNWLVVLEISNNTLDRILLAEAPSWSKGLDLLARHNFEVNTRWSTLNTTILQKEWWEGAVMNEHYS